MKTLMYLICALLIPASFVSAQDRKTVLVKAGTSIIDYFPDQDRYLYPQFSKGTIRFNDGTYYNSKLNYDVLSGEIIFIQADDTLAIARRDIDKVETESDTFYYDNGFLRIIGSHYPVLLLAKQYVKLSNISKEGPYGTTNMSSSVQTYTNVYHNARYNLTEKEDLTLSIVTDYYIGNKVIGFSPFKVKSIQKLYPENKKEIEQYIESNHIDLSKHDDIVKFTKYLYGLKTNRI